jgi:hypothetical protein
MKVGIGLVALLGLVCYSESNAVAHDLCIQIFGGPSYAALKSPKLQLNCCPPDPSEVNTCAPLNGVEEGGLGGMITGTGCLSKSGEHFFYHYVYHSLYQPFVWDPNLKAYFETGVCRFRMGALGGRLSGRCRGTALTNPAPPGKTGTFIQDAVLWPCSPGASDVPDGDEPQ